MEKQDSGKPEYRNSQGQPYPVFIRHYFWELKTFIVRISAFEGKVIKVTGIYQFDMALGLQKLVDMDYSIVEETLKDEGFVKIEEL